jgi:hypothetical protein
MSQTLVSIRNQINAVIQYQSLSLRYTSKLFSLLPQGLPSCPVPFEFPIVLSTHSAKVSTNVGITF